MPTQLLPGIFPHKRGDRVRLSTRKAAPDAPEVPGPGDDDLVASEEVVFIAGEPMLIDDTWHVSVLTGGGREFVPIVDVKS